MTRAHAKRRRGATLRRAAMRYFDTFTGIGGFTIPLRELGHECVGFSEVDRHAIQVYSHHFPEHRNYGDITRIDAGDLPDFDILCGGFPCQAFSVAGKRRGFADTRGTLFFDLRRIAEAKRPRLLLFENVKGVLSHDGGNTFGTILASLDELGYDLQWQVLNSKDFDVPQNRERVFIVGHTRGTPRPEVFPLAGGGGAEVIEATAGVPQSVRVYSPDGVAPTLFGNCSGGGKTCKIIQRPRGNNKGGVREEDLAPTVQKGIGDGNVAVIYEQNIDGRTRVRDVCPTLRSPNTIWNMPVNTGACIRRLTPVECERLQGFPDGWTAGASDTQRYKMLGNAVTVNVVRAIVGRLRDAP